MNPHKRLALVSSKKGVSCLSVNNIDELECTAKQETPTFHSK